MPDLDNIAKDPRRRRIRRHAERARHHLSMLIEDGAWPEIKPILMMVDNSYYLETRNRPDRGSKLRVVK